MCASVALVVSDTPACVRGEERCDSSASLAGGKDGTTAGERCTARALVHD